MTGSSCCPGPPVVSLPEAVRRPKIEAPGSSSVRSQNRRTVPSGGCSEVRVEWPGRTSSHRLVSGAGLTRESRCGRPEQTNGLSHGRHALGDARPQCMAPAPHRPPAASVERGR